MAKAKYKNLSLTDSQRAEVLADLKKRSRSGSYMEITVNVPYRIFETFVETIQDDLRDNQELQEEVYDYDTLAVRTDVRAEFERQIEDLSFDDISDNYGDVDFDYDFIPVMFQAEIVAAEEIREAQEAAEYAEEMARQKEREAEELRRRATLTTIEVTNENYSKALAVLKAAGLVK